MYWNWNSAYCHIKFIHRFLLWKSNLLTKSGISEALLSLTIFPALLNSRYEATLVARIDRYFLAKELSSGYVGLLACHHSRGLTFLSERGRVARYRSSSSFMHLWGFFCIWAGVVVGVIIKKSFHDKCDPWFLDLFLLATAASLGLVQGTWSSWSWAWHSLFTEELMSE